MEAIQYFEGQRLWYEPAWDPGLYVFVKMVTRRWAYLDRGNKNTYRVSTGSRHVEIVEKPGLGAVGTLWISQTEAELFHTDHHWNNKHVPDQCSECVALRLR